MHPPPTPSWWSRLWRKPAPPVDDDAGDMGTAFGMEMTFDVDPPPKVKGKADTSPPATRAGGSRKG